MAERMAGQTVVIEQGLVSMLRTGAWLEEYLHEMAMFSTGKYDDQADSTTQTFEAIGKKVAESPARCS